MENARKFFDKINPELGMHYKLDDFETLLMCHELAIYFTNTNTNLFSNHIFIGYRGKDSNVIEHLKNGLINDLNWWLSLSGMDLYLVKDIHRRVKYNKLN